MSSVGKSLADRLHRPHDIDHETVEDIFESGLCHLFPDTTQNLHGDAGSRIIYTSDRFGDLELQLADPGNRHERWLFAQYLWNASLLLAIYIEQAGVPPTPIPMKTTDDGVYDLEAEGFSKRCDLSPGHFDMKGHKVLEIGAGTGLAGIVSGLVGAEEVVITDYPASCILDPINANVAKNVSKELKAKVSVAGHEWGSLEDAISLARGRQFSRILCADCLWMDGQHEPLTKTMQHFLSPSPDASVLVIAGFHTGRAKVAHFFDIAVQARFAIVNRWEEDVLGVRRRWEEHRNEDIEERKKWLIIAILQRAVD